MTNIDKKAESIIRNNSRGNFTIPCKNLYPFQWNWDSAFSALGIFSYDKERAISEVNTLFKGQWSNGMIPQIIFHQKSDSYYPGPDVWQSNTVPETSCITQPPVISSVVWNMVLLGLDDKELLDNWFDNLFRYHLWFTENRDPYHKGLVSIFHPWESGRDNSPDWDNALKNIPVDPNLEIPRKDRNLIKDSLRPTDDDYNRYIQIVNDCKSYNWNNLEIYNHGLFNVCDPGVQFIFLRACKDLYKLAIHLNRNLSYEYLERWITLYENGSNKLWNDSINAYSTLDIKSNTLFKGISCASMLYAYADIGDKTQRQFMISHSKRILYHSKYGFPSWDPRSVEFDSKRYWRGPIWCIINYLLYVGFNNIHEVELSKKIKSHTIELIEKFGFFEYFDPNNGRGYGGDNFSWTAAMYLVFKQDDNI